MSDTDQQISGNEQDENDENIENGSDASDASFIDVDPDLRIEGVLEAPITVEFTALELFNMLEEDEIDLEAPYQRAVVWKQPAQSALIESLLRNLYVAPILLKREDMEETGPDSYVCIDGKQRLTSIQMFFKGEIPCTISTLVDEEEEEWWYQKPRTTEKHLPKVMATHYSKKLEQVKIKATVYVGISEEDESEIFQRVQKGKPLAAAERLAALPGDPNEWLKEVSTSLTIALLKGIRFRHAHKAAQFAITRAVWILSRLAVEDTFPRLPTTDELHTWITQATRVRGTAPPDSLLPSALHKRTIKTIVEIFIELATKEKYNKVAFCDSNQLPIIGDPEFKKQLNLTRKGKPRTGFLSPVEFVLILVHISRHMDLHRGTLARQIHNFRNEVHFQYHGEKKFNDKLAKLYYNWEAALEEPRNTPESVAPEEDENEDGTFAFQPRVTQELPALGSGPVRTRKQNKAKHASPMGTQRGRKGKQT